MPLFSPVMSTAMILKGSSQLLGGAKFPDIVSAMSKATCSYLMSSATVLSTNYVVGPGSGMFTGKIVGLSGSLMSNMMVLSAASKGLGGRDIKKLMDSVAFGVVSSVNLVMVQGTVIGGGPGTGIGKIIGLVPSVLQVLILANLAGKILIGSQSHRLISAISTGICTHIMSTGTVTSTCVGVFTPPPVGPVPVITVSPGRFI